MRQVKRALQVMSQLDLDQEISILGIAKGPDRKVGLERYFLGTTGVNIDGHSPAAHLLQHIRDEAHRFAITGHRQRRAKARNQSQLEGVAGVGAKNVANYYCTLAVLALLKAQALKSSAKSKASAVQLRQKSTNTSTETLIE